MLTWGGERSTASGSSLEAGSPYPLWGPRPVTVEAGFFTYEGANAVFGNILNEESHTNSSSLDYIHFKRST